MSGDGGFECLGRPAHGAGRGGQRRRRSGRFSAVMPIAPSPWRSGWCRAAPTPRTSSRTPSFVSGPTPRAGVPAGRAFPLGCIGSSSISASTCTGAGSTGGTTISMQRSRWPTRSRAWRRGSSTRPNGRALAAAVRRLPDRQRTALALTYAGGLSNAEVAEIMDISVGAVESLLVRARRDLRTRVGGGED